MSEEAVVQAFTDRFGAKPEVVTAAPGRVNLIGEHTDYNEGFVLPAAIDLYVWVAAARGKEGNYASLTTDSSSWLRYPQGIEAVLHRTVGERCPMSAMVSSNLPMGTGLSSSAALEMALLSAANELYALDLTPMDMAKLGQRCENEEIGLQSGLMDQVASSMGVEDHALFFDTRTLEVRFAHIPAGISIVVCDTGKPRELASSKYNERRAECEAAAAALGVRSLRDATLSMVLDGHLPPLLMQRAKHVVTENSRTQQTFQALSSDLSLLSDLFRASHISLRDDYEVSSAELDAMAEACWAAPGCVGARMTGAGFGGACVALVESDHGDAFLQSVSQAYTATIGSQGTFTVCRASHGARRVA